MARGWVGVDLDGTLAEYHGWKGHTHVGAPIKPMVERIKRWLVEGRVDIRIVTARVSSSDELENAETRLAIRTWCQIHIGRTFPIVCCKDFDMLELWDDRAVQVEANTGNLIGRSTRGLG
jgi:hypothetical protein